RSARHKVFRRLGTGKHTVDVPLIGFTDFTGFSQPVDVEAITLLGRDAAGGRMWLSQITILFEIRHDIPDGRWAEFPVHRFRKRPRPDRLTGIYVGPDDQFQNVSSPGIEFPAIAFCHHRAFYSTQARIGSMRRLD